MLFGVGEGKIRRGRMLFLTLILFAAAFAFAARLLSLQVANKEYYTERATPKNLKVIAIEPSRGEIADRSGERLVINVGVQNIRLNKSLLPAGEENRVLLSFLDFLEGEGQTAPDLLPVDAHDRYIPPTDPDKARALKVFLRVSELSEEDFAGTGLYDLLYKRYRIEKTLPDASEYDIRRVIGLRYTLEGSDFAVTNPFTALENADIGLVTRLSERLYELPGVEVVVANSRKYTYGTLAAHVLGRTGPIFPEEADAYKEKGYALDATVGKNGAEAAFEEYLRGKTGYKTVEYSADGETILNETVSEENPPKYGKTVYLTLSAGMQNAAEQSLREVIEAINTSNIRSGNPDRCTGAVVVENCNTGEIYVSASYPTYDQNTYRDTVSELLNDERAPLLNRAADGIYPPGSTFKIATAAAALDAGIIGENTRYYDTGIYKEYSDYQPHCWYFDMHGVGHGWQNVVDAIKNSCNYFFFEVGRQLGTDRLNDYAKKLGLGEKTGIETGESAGILAGPEYRASLGKPWNPGDLVQSAIGQSDNAFTPLQLASFFSTVVNGGTRYKTHLLKSVNDFYTGATEYEAKPEILSEIDLPAESLELLKRGMKSVVEDGTAASVFIRYPYSVGGKTGTAQRGGNGGDNAVFAGFAPYETPEIVVSVIIENGEHSYTAATVAKSVFDYYFEHPDEFR